MSLFLPEAVRKGLEEARVALFGKSGRLCVHDGDNVFRVLRLWDGGFAVSADAPPMRGFVDLYDGPKHLYQCLVFASREEGDERIFDFKWNTRVADAAPVDYPRTEDPLPGLITRML